VTKKTPQEQFKTTKQRRNGQEIIITGLKLPPPAKRIVLEQNHKKVLNAKITRINKNGSVSLTIKRINHLPKINQTRLHTEEVVFPGKYELRLNVKP